MLARRFSPLRFLGIDYSEEMIAQAKARQYSAKVRFKVADVMSKVNGPHLVDQPQLARMKRLRVLPKTLIILVGKGSVEEGLEEVVGLAEGFDISHA